MRRLVLLAALLGSGCTYPDFEFSARTDGSIGDGSGALDATGEDSSRDVSASDTGVGEDVADDASVDSAVVDTTSFVDSGVVDSGVVDSPIVDSRIVDSAVVDSGVVDSGVVDGARDGLVADTAVDAKVDAASDAQTSTGCTSSVAKHCWDWDQSSVPEAGFTFPSVSPTGSITVEAGGRSTPNEFVSATSPGAGPVVVANVSQVFTTTAFDSLVKLDVWIKLDSATYPTTSDGAAFVLKLQRSAGTGDGITFGLGGAGFYVDRIAVDYAAYAISSYAPKIGVWMHVRVHTRLHTTAGSITVWIDDMSLPVLARSSISTVAIDSTEKQLILGLYSQGSSAPFKARYDDAELDY